MDKTKMTPEELREFHIIQLGYEIQFEECDDEDREGLGEFEGGLKQKYYDLAKEIFEEDEREKNK